MIEKVLNKLGLYTKRQYLEIKAQKENYEKDIELWKKAANVYRSETNHLSEENIELKEEILRLINALKTSEEVKISVIKENEELKKEIESLRLRD